jgi:hypothetical protein
MVPIIYDKIMKTNKIGRSSLLGISIVVFLILRVQNKIRNNGMIPAKRTQIPDIKKNELIVFIRFIRINIGIDTIGAAVNNDINCATVSIEL